MALLVLIRHGQSQWNLENRFTGWIDVPLTDLGRQEARQGASYIKDIRFVKAYTSALQRAQETLHIVLDVIGQSGIPIKQNQALNERHYGDLQGLNKTETAKKFGDQQVHLWRRSYDIAPPNGESLKDTAARTLPYFQTKIMPEVTAGRNILVVAHGNSLRSIVMYLDQLTKEQVLELNIPTGAPIVYEIDAQGRVVTKRERQLPAADAPTPSPHPSR